MSRNRVVLTTAAAGLGLAAAAVAGAAAGQRSAVRRIHRRPDPQQGEPYGTQRGRPVPVVADDGIRLYAEIDGDDRTDLAIVFSHGWAVNQDCWHHQRKALRELGRLVFWDQRGHGRSDDAAGHSYRVEQLGPDLAAVIEQTVPAETPVVLVGHSMGGITIQRYADLVPEAFGKKIIAAGLVNTSAGDLGRHLPGRFGVLDPIAGLLVPLIRAGIAAAPVIERARPLMRDGTLLFGDQLAFAPGASPTAVAALGAMSNQARTAAVLSFLASVRSYERFGTLAALKQVATLIVTAKGDLLTPISHSATLAEELPDARLEIVPGVGHMSIMERPDLVNGYLRDLVERAQAARP